MANVTPSAPARRLKVVGTGAHHDTFLLDAETGEDVGKALNVHRIHLSIGGADGFPDPTIMLELRGGVEFSLSPESKEALSLLPAVGSQGD